MPALQVAYLDFVGSGVETIAHIRDNGRVTILFCSFEPSLPRNLRLWGKGTVVERGEAGYEELRARVGITLDAALEVCACVCVRACTRACVRT
jgi:hypothetical protein